PEAHSLLVAGCPRGPGQSIPSLAPQLQQADQIHPSIRGPEGKEGLNYERRGGFVVAEPGRAALHPGGAAAGGGLLAAVVGPHHHHCLVPRPLVPRARPPGRDGRADRRGRPPPRRRGPLGGGDAPRGFREKPRNAEKPTKYAGSPKSNAPRVIHQPR
ncbi:Protein EARLY RESPONSIVE TO DEHYDRATION 15, partial [Zea mays]